MDARTEVERTTAVARKLLDEVRGFRSDLEELGYLKPSELSEFERARDRAEQKRQLRVLDGGRA
jgi:hypothetical protein